MQSARRKQELSWFQIWVWLTNIAVFVANAVYVMNTKGQWDWGAYIVGVIVMSVITNVLWAIAWVVSDLKAEAKVQPGHRQKASRSTDRIGR